MPSFRFSTQINRTKKFQPVGKHFPKDKLVGTMVELVSDKWFYWKFRFLCDSNKHILITHHPINPSIIIPTTIPSTYQPIILYLPSIRQPITDASAHRPFIFNQSDYQPHQPINLYQLTKFPTHHSNNPKSQNPSTHHTVNLPILINLSVHISQHINTSDTLTLLNPL